MIYLLIVFVFLLANVNDNFCALFDIGKMASSDKVDLLRIAHSDKP